jgi:hypothetical protein
MINVFNKNVSIAGQTWNLAFGFEKEENKSAIEPTNTENKSAIEPTNTESKSAIEPTNTESKSAIVKPDVAHLLPETSSTYKDYIQSVQIQMAGPNARVVFPSDSWWGFTLCTCLFVGLFFLRGNVL